MVSAVTDPWVDGVADPLFYYSEDISGIINEIISLPGWGGDHSFRSRASSATGWILPNGSRHAGLS